MTLILVLKPLASKTGVFMCSEQELEKTRPGHHASALARRPTTELELMTTPRMVAERLVASLRSLHGWGRCFQSRVVRTRPGGSRWTKPLISLQKGSCVVVGCRAAYVRD